MEGGSERDYEDSSQAQKRKRLGQGGNSANKKLHTESSSDSSEDDGVQPTYSFGATPTDKLEKSPKKVRALSNFSTTSRNLRQSKLTDLFTSKNPSLMIKENEDIDSTVNVESKHEASFTKNILDLTTNSFNTSTGENDVVYNQLESSVNNSDCEQLTQPGQFDLEILTDVVNRDSPYDQPSNTKTSIPSRVETMRDRHLANHKSFFPHSKNVMFQERNTSTLVDLTTPVEGIHLKLDVTPTADITKSLKENPPSDPQHTNATFFSFQKTKKLEVPDETKDVLLEATSKNMEAMRLAERANWYRKALENDGYPQWVLGFQPAPEFATQRTLIDKLNDIRRKCAKDIMQTVAEHLEKEAKKAELNATKKYSLVETDCLALIEDKPTAEATFESAQKSSKKSVRKERKKLRQELDKKSRSSKHNAPTEEELGDIYTAVLKRNKKPTNAFENFPRRGRGASQSHRGRRPGRGRGKENAV